MSTSRLAAPVATRKKAPKATRQDLPSIAILPFSNGGTEAVGIHLLEGLAEEILHLLNQVQTLKVFARTSTFPHAASDLSLQDLGKRLGARHLLHGHLTHDGPHFHLRAELMDVASGVDVWVTQEQLDRSDVRSLLNELALSIAAYLQVPAPSCPTRQISFEAYNHYLMGRHHFFRFSRQGMLAAIQAFEAATQCDPGCAGAWASMALCAAYMHVYVERSERYRAMAADASQRALEINDGLAEGHVARGVALAAEGRGEEACEAFEAALQRNPDLYEAYYFYARHCYASGRPEEAIQYFEWASALRPEDYQAPLLVALAYTNLGIEDEAHAARKRGLARVEDRLARHPEDPRAWYMGANALVGLGEKAKGLAWARKARDLDPEDSMLLYNLACIHALAGESQEALDCLEQAVTAGLSEKGWILNDEDLTTLHGTPRFQALIQRL